jgi:hypothetical protein
MVDPIVQNAPDQGQKTNRQEQPNLHIAGHGSASLRRAQTISQRPHFREAVP